VGGVGLAAPAALHPRQHRAHGQAGTDNGEQRAPLSAETSFSFFPPFPPGVTAVFAPGE